MSFVKRNLVAIQFHAKIKTEGLIFMNYAMLKHENEVNKMMWNNFGEYCTALIVIHSEEMQMQNQGRDMTF